MKKLTLVVAALLLSIPVFAQDGDKAQILGSPHDMTTWSATLSQTGTASAQVCAFCHIPHAVQGSGAANTPAGLPLLWNHQLPTNTTYTPYSSAMLKATLSNDFSTSNAFYSLACLSCHDGSTAIGAVYRMPDNDTLQAGVTMTTIDPAEGAMHLVGANNDLSQTHPVNFTYDATLVAADTGLWDVGTAANVRQIGSTALTAIRPGTAAVNGALLQPILFNNTMQCATCHNPHSEANQDFLRVPVGSTVSTNTAGTPSWLCLKCHSTQAIY